MADSGGDRETSRACVSFLLEDATPAWCPVSGPQGI